MKKKSLATGRLPTFAGQFIDCELPADMDQTISDEGKILPSCKMPSLVCYRIVSLIPTFLLLLYSPCLESQVWRGMRFFCCPRHLGCSRTKIFDGHGSGQKDPRYRAVFGVIAAPASAVGRIGANNDIFHAAQLPRLEYVINT